MLVREVNQNPHFKIGRGDRVTSAGDIMISMASNCHGQPSLGQIVSGYELWMDAWSGGEPSLVCDGAGSPDVTEFRLTTRDLGLHSQIVETGRQYRFQVRAINNCDTNDSSRSCFGEFSEVQVLTVRDPRAPLPPSMPQRDSETQVMSLNEAAISISWVPPTDNGGSPITGYILFMKDHSGTMTSYVLDREITKWQVQLPSRRAIVQCCRR